MLKIKFARLEKKLTQFAVSKRTGISQTRLCYFERGLMVPADKEIVRLSRVLGVPAEELFESMSVQKAVG